MSATEPGSKFDPITTMSEAWLRLKDNLAAFIVAMIIVGVIAIGVAMLMNIVTSIMAHIPLIGRFQVLAISAAIGLIVGPFQVGLFRMAREAVDHRPVSWQDIFSGFDKLPQAAPAGALIAIVEGLGGLNSLLGIIGLVLFFLWLTTWIWILEGASTFWDAMEKSRLFIMANYLQWVLLAVVLLVCVVIALIPCGLGMIVMGPLAAITITLAADQQRNAGHMAQVTPTTAEPV